jgi:hypothetical protein
MHSVAARRHSRLALSIDPSERLSILLLWLFFAFISARSANAHGAVLPATNPSSDQMSMGGPEAVVQSAELAQVKIWRSGDRPEAGRKIRWESARLDLRVRYAIAEGERSARQLILLLPSAVLTEDPGANGALREIDASKILHGAFDRGAVEVDWARFRGQSVVPAMAASSGKMVIELPPGGEAGTLELALRVKVPRQFWPFGCVRSRCAAAGAGAPLPSLPAINGPFGDRAARVVKPVKWTIGEVAFARPTCSDFDVHGSCKEDTLLVSAAGLDPAQSSAYPMLIWGRNWQREVQVFDGVAIEWYGLDDRPGRRYPRMSLLGANKDAAGHVFALAKDIVGAFDAEVARLPGTRRMVIVQGPLRLQMTQAHGNTLLVSDAALQLVGLPRLARFHRQELARGLCDLLAFDWLAFAQEPSDWVWAGSMLGVHLLDAWAERQNRRDEDAEDLLSNLTFFPFVDRFLYAGQNAFGGSYFRSVEDDEPLRSHPLRLTNDLPSGRRVHEKLSDLLSSEQLAAVYAHLLADPGTPIQEAAESAYGRRLGWFFEQWLSAYPEVDYAIREFHSAPREGGDGFEHEVVLVRAAQRGIVEPVQVYARERGGREHFLVWNGESAPGEALAAQPAYAQHVWHFFGDEALESVWLDPRTRLHETAKISNRSWERIAADDPKFNNRRPALPRFIYTGIGLQVAASELSRATSFAAKLNAIDGYAFFLGGLRRDLRRSWTFDVAKGRETLVGVGASLNFSFREKVMANRRRTRFRLGFSTDWLSAQSLDPRGGLRLSQGIGLVDDTRRAIFRPEQGRSLSIGVGFSEVFRLSGQPDTRMAWSVGAQWIELWRLMHGHVIATSLEIGTVAPLVGDLEFRSLKRGGGVDGLSAYTADELFARSIAQGRWEYRHVFRDDLRLGLAGLAWMRDIGGTLGAGVASISACESSAGWYGAKSWFGQISYGLNSVVEIFGMSPQMVRIEVAVPLVRRERTCLGQEFPDWLAVRQGLPPERAPGLLPNYAISLTFFPSF